MVQSTATRRGFPWGWVIAGILLGVALYFGWKMLHRHGGDAAPGGMGQAMPVNVVSVHAQPTIRWTEASGRFEAVNAVDIRPQVSGAIVGIYFTDGAEVKRGQKLFTIDPRPYEAAMMSARGQLAAAQSSFGNATTDLKRAKTLIAAKAISRAEYETRLNNYQSAAGNLDAARGQVHAAEVNLAYTQITAPLAGRISRAEVTSGNLVDSGSSAPLLASIVAVSPIYASFDLDEQTFLGTIQGVSAAKLKRVPVEVGLSNDQGTPIKAVVHSFDNHITPGSGTIRVRALIQNADGRLVPGLYARVRIGASDPTPTVMMTPTAVNTDQSKKYVLVAAPPPPPEKGAVPQGPPVPEGTLTAQYREVTLAPIQDGMQPVVKGLNEGDKVIVSNLQKLRPGSPVNPTEVDPVTLQPPQAATPENAAPDAAAKSDGK